MRLFCAIIVATLFLTACQKQRVTTAVAEQNQAPLVIDYPAGIMISSENRVNQNENQKFSFAERILAPHRIPVLDSSSSKMVFVKVNGDRVNLSMDEMAGKYDIILFNGVSNPVPLKISDLQNAVYHVFNFTENKDKSTRKTKYFSEVTTQATDTLPRSTFRKRLAELRSRDKKMVISSPDTSQLKFTQRNIPGVQWVEQRVDSRSMLTISFANDLITYANTDRYFTNGITFDLQAAWLGNTFLDRLMIPYRHQANVTYNMSLVQDMYTPTDTRVTPTMENDRPYSSYLYLGYRKITADKLRNLKISSQLDAGYIGPYSPGSYLQTLVHNTFPTNDVPLGWETQINTDVILNYTVEVQKALVKKENTSLLAGTEIQAGTLYTNAGVSLEFQAGKFEPVFGLSANEKWPAVQYYFFARTEVDLVAYNALLQGGMFNNNNIYTLKTNQINQVVGKAEAGIHARYKGIGIELSQNYLSPEYKGGLWHKWGKISLLFRL